MSLIFSSRFKIVVMEGTWLQITSLDIFKQFVSLETVFYRPCGEINIPKCPNGAMWLILCWQVTNVLQVLNTSCLEPHLTASLFATSYFFSLQVSTEILTIAKKNCFRFAPINDVFAERHDYTGCVCACVRARERVCVYVCLGGGVGGIRDMR